jgi:hypothetical protein
VETLRPAVVVLDVVLALARARHVLNLSINNKKIAVEAIAIVP